MPSPLARTLARQRLVNSLGIEAVETLLTDDATYYVPPNDQLEGDHNGSRGQQK